MKFYTDNNGQIVNPYDYNYVAMKAYRDRKDNETVLTPNAEAMLTDSTYNYLGKFLGVDNKKEWSENYDKVYEVVQWAKRETKSEDVYKLYEFLKKAINETPAMNGRRLDDLCIAAKLDMYKPDENKKDKEEKDGR